MAPSQNAPTDLTRPRTLAATILAAALTAALTSDDRLAAAHREIHHATPKGTWLPGHIELARRECAYRLAHAAQLTPGGLLTPNLARGLDNRDRAWPRPIRRTVLLSAASHLPATPDPGTLGPNQPPNAPAITTEHVTTSLHAAARHAATHLRSARARTLTQALTNATREVTRDLPAGYDLLLERELTLRLSLALALPTTGALAPGLDTALAHATHAATRTQLADLILTAVRPKVVRQTAIAAPRSYLGFVPRQGNAGGACTCACTRGGFCGGCGHAGCSHR